MNHIKKSRITIIITLVLLGVLVSFIPAAAQAQHLDFTGTTCMLSQSPPEKFWISEDGILHMRGIVTQNIDVAGPYDTGTASMTMNIDINPITGEGHGYGTFTIYPAAYNGTFEGHWSSHISPDGLRGSAAGHGTGDLEGLQTFNNMSSDTPNDPCTNSSITILIP